MTEKIMNYIDRQIKMYNDITIENNNPIKITFGELFNMLCEARTHELKMLKKRIEKGLILDNGEYL